MLKYIGYSIVLTSFFLFSGLMLKAQNESNVIVDTLTAIIYFEKENALSRRKAAKLAREQKKSAYERA